MCFKSKKNEGAPHGERAKKKGAMQRYLCKDMYAQEVKFNLKGETEVPSTAGKCLSFSVRMLVLTFLIERLIAWHSFDKFKIQDFETKIDFTDGTYDANSLNFKALDFDMMIGFDKKLAPEVGKFDFNILTFGADGKVSDLELLTSEPCSEDHDGVIYAAREVGSTYGETFDMHCLSRPDLIGITGNRHSEFKHQRLSISFTRCTKESGLACTDIKLTEPFFKQASLMVFTTKHNSMLNDIANSDQPNQQLDKDVYIHK